MDIRRRAILSKKSSGGDVDIDTTYSIMYTSSDGNVVTPYKINVFGASITSNTYVNGQGIITFNRPVTSIGSYTFYQCTTLTSITIPDSVTSIGSYSFKNCSGLTSIIIPNSVTSIGSSAFRECPSLTSVTIPDSVTSIGKEAFDTCTSLTGVTIPDSVTSIGNYAFYSCTKLEAVYCKPTTPPTGGNNMFYNNASDRKIYVPTASVDAYKSATYWSNYADYIVGYDFDGGNKQFTVVYFPNNPRNYTYEEGMTFEDFINSEYNIEGWEAVMEPGEPDVVYCLEYGPMRDENGASVYIADTITSEKIYYLG